MENINPEKLCKVWAILKTDRDANDALERLKNDGFDISKLVPGDGQYPNWADYIAAIPLVSYRPSRRRIHSNTSLRKHWALVPQLRRLAANVEDRFCDLDVMSTLDIPSEDTLRPRFAKRLIETAKFLETLFSWNWTTRDRNPRNALIAELRWQIRYRTGRPHDAELAALIDAAVRAAGRHEGLYIDATALDRIEKREKESRVKAARRLRALLDRPAPSSRGR